MNENGFAATMPSLYSFVLYIKNIGKIRSGALMMCTIGAALLAAAPLCDFSDCWMRNASAPEVGSEAHSVHARTDILTSRTGLLFVI